MNSTKKGFILSLFATSALAQSAPQINLLSPITTPGAPRLSVAVENAQINQALASLYASTVQKNQLAAAIGGTDLSAGMVTPTAGSPESMAALAATVQGLNFQSQGAVERINPAILAPLLIPSDTNGFNGVARSPGAIAADHNDIFSHGAICDSQSHTLNTLGLTLPQLQKVFGNQVTSISQTIEADAMGVQAAINEARTKGSPAQNMGAGFIFGQASLVTAGGARGVCILGMTRIDQTLIKSGSVKFDGGGTQFISSVRGDAAWDISGQVGDSLDDLSVIGAFANFAATITGTDMQVTLMNNTTPIRVGDVISTNQATPVAVGTTVVSQNSGTPGGIGDYTVSISQPTPVPSENLVTIGPNECLLTGRSTTTNGGGLLNIKRLKCSGSFAIDDVVSNSSEDTTFDQPILENFAPNAGAVGADGLGHLAQCSTVPGVPCPAPDHQQSFNTFIMHEPKLYVHGINDWCIWEAQSHGHVYDNGYCHDDGNGTTVGIVKYFGIGAISNEDKYIMHFEPQSLTAIMRLTGAANPRVSKMTIADYGAYQSGPVFSATSEVTKINLTGLDASFDQLQGTSPTWFDNPALYVVTGNLFTQDGVGLAIPPTFSGNVCQPGTGSNPATCLPYQNGQPLSAGSGSTALTAVPPKTTGQWYGSNDPGTEMQRANCTISVPGQVAYYPMWNGSTAWKTTRAGMNVTTAAGTGGALRIGLYTDNGNGAPGTLVQDFGEIATTTNGAPSSAAVTSFTIPHGLSWIAEQVDAVGATPAQSWGITCKSASNAPLACFAQQVMGSNSPTASTGFGNYGLVSTSINTGAFPTTDPGTLSATATACIPAVGFYLSGFTP